MAGFGHAELDEAYRAPYSAAAKDIIASLNLDKVEHTFLDTARDHLIEISKLVQNGRMRRRMKFTETSMDSIKLNYVKAYAYCRMLLSAIKDAELIEYFATAEASRSASAVQSLPEQSLIRIMDSIGLAASPTPARFGDAYSMKLADFLRAVGDNEGISLSNYPVSKGFVYLSKSQLIPLIRDVSMARIKAGLPIDQQNIPKEVVSYAKEVNISKKYKYHTSFKGETWIDRLLQNPISDVRHRTVNIILAPYLVNTKGMDVDSAAKIINEYIERCKKINPATDITPSYVKYQCNYAKRRGLKPMSFENAKELLGSVIDIDVIKPKRQSQQADAEGAPKPSK